MKRALFVLLAGSLLLDTSSAWAKKRSKGHDSHLNDDNTGELNFAKDFNDEVKEQRKAEAKDAAREKRAEEKRLKSKSKSSRSRSRKSRKSQQDDDLQLKSL